MPSDRARAEVKIPCPGCPDPGGICTTSFRCRRDDAPCSRKGCGKLLTEHDYGVFCP